MKTYGPGATVEHIIQFEAALQARILLYHKAWGRTVAPIVLANMQYRVVKNFVEQGLLSFARKI